MPFTPKQGMFKSPNPIDSNDDDHFRFADSRNASTMNRLKTAHKALASLLLSVMIMLMSATLGALLERALIPNPCLYHTSEYLGGKEPPWWISTFFPLDPMRHPEPGIFYMTLWLVVGSFLIAFFIRKLTHFS